MLRSLIVFCLSRRPLVLTAYAAFVGIGIAAFTAMNIEAYPDPAPPIIEIIAQWPGQSPAEVERYVTIPLESAVSSTHGLKYIRSKSDDGLRSHAAADHERHLGRQFQRGWPYHRDGRAVGQCAWAWRHRLAGGHRQHRVDAAGRRAGPAFGGGQGPDRIHAAARH